MRVLVGVHRLSVGDLGRGCPPALRDQAGGVGAEQSPLLESTINRLRLTRDLLSESKAPTAETISPTGIGPTEATVNGEVNSYGAEIESCKFEYGSSESHGKSVECEAIPQASAEPSVVSAKVTKWTKDGAFHERLVVTVLPPILRTREPTVSTDTQLRRVAIT